MRNSYSSLSSLITSSDTRAMDGQLLSGLFLFNVNLINQTVALVLFYHFEESIRDSGRRFSDIDLVKVIFWIGHCRVNSSLSSPQSE